MNRGVFVCSASLLALLASPAFAQDAGKADSGDIIVTATRDSTQLSKTPITMTALTSKSLRDEGITDARQLENAVPGLSLNENGDAVRISIRGVTSTDTTEKGDPSAAFLLDGIYIARPSDMMGSFYDLQQIEVLRGPQGTLYGRNTTAGVINVKSALPTDKFEASFDGGYGNLNTIDATGMVNVPLGAGVGLRAAVNYQRQDPYYTVSNSTVPTSPYRDVLSGRLSLGGKTLDDKLSFVVRADFSGTKGTGVNGNVVTLDRFYTNLNVPTVDPVYVGNSSGFERTLTVPPTYPMNRDNKNYGIMGEFTYDLGPVQLTYLGSFRWTDRSDVRDLLLFGALNNPAAFNGNFKQNSHELRLAFGKGKPLHGQAGVYYFHERSYLEFDLYAPLSGFVVPGASNFAFPQGPVTNQSKAVFGTLTYDITPALHLSGGVRYTSDLKARDGATIVDFPNTGAFPTGFACNNQSTLPSGSVRCVLNQNIASRTFEKTTWKVGLDYDAPGLGLIYASVATGYKAGGFNDGCVAGSGIGCSLTPSSLYYNPETLTDYEAGIKFKLAQTVHLDAAVFHYDYNSLQVSQIVTVPVPATLITNAA
ncbi:MAG: TonB-dependent receptor, partial [Alphaproteobacteria bacterium]|nr:TonB-dependent receptor [Alphaproteobacteria bacterium]